MDESSLPLKGGQQPVRQIKTPPLDIAFHDLTYSVPDSKLKSGWRQLLKSVNGKFHSEEVTAILGPSGAGKSTLLNILAGYVTAGVKGSIKINGKPRELKSFNKLSSYIMQEDLLQPRLSVREAMLFAANLKLGSKSSLEEKCAAVDEVINLLGLQKCYETRTEHLSGGQRRRLSIALELVNNPPIIFLDEPTTGLDNVAIKKCMDLLHKIARLGRTVICTIHQPPASLFQNFDQVYVMADGYCVFNGSPSKLVPFMSNANCDCPTTSTPADYIIEVVQSNPENINILQNHAQNGKCNIREWKEATSDHRADSYGIGEIYKDTPVIEKADMQFASSVWSQFWIIIYRMFLQMSRNKTMLYIQFFHHLISGILIGGIFLGTGNDASQTMSVFKCCLSVNVFFMYTYVMAPVLLFPLELQLIRREYFNRWYSLKAYFLAVTISNIPLLVMNGIMFNLIVYILADQPWEWQRFFWFNVMGITIGLCSQGLGYAVGSSFNILNGCVVAPHIIAVLLAFAVYGMGYKESIEPFMKVMMSLSYLRDGLEGFTGSLFYLRKPLECGEEYDYCHYRNPAVLMEDMGMKNSKPSDNFFYICISLVVFRVIAYISLKYRMTSELRNKLVYFAAKVVKQNEN